MNPRLTIRPASIDDASDLLSIYRPFVIDTIVSFEIESPTVEEFAGRIEAAFGKYPWFVCETVGNDVAGYAYACAHRSRAGYRYSVETSVYVAPSNQGQGVGALLYQALFAELKDKGYCNAYAGIALPNSASIAFHKKTGFREIGIFESVGYKFDQWHDVAWFHKPIEKSKQ